MIIERHNVVAQKAVMPKKMPKHKKIIVEDDIHLYCITPRGTCKFPLEMGSLTHFQKFQIVFLIVRGRP